MDSEDLHARVVARIRERCKAQSLTTIQLADQAGVSRSHLFSILAGEASATLDYLARIAEGLGCDPYELLEPYEDW